MRVSKGVAREGGEAHLAYRKIKGSRADFECRDRENTWWSK
jgi:hypothetical protein